MTPTKARKLGAEIKRAIRSHDGEEILDCYGMNLWTEGGCFALAHAIQKEYGGTLLAVVKHGKKNIAEHVVVLLGGLLLDGDGAASTTRLLGEWEERIGTDDLTLIPLEDAITKDIECDPHAVLDIRDLLREKVGDL